MPVSEYKYTQPLYPLTPTLKEQKAIQNFQEKLYGKPMGIDTWSDYNDINQYDTFHNTLSSNKESRGKEQVQEKRPIVQEFYEEVNKPTKEQRDYKRSEESYLYKYQPKWLKELNLRIPYTKVNLPIGRMIPEAELFLRSINRGVSLSSKLEEGKDLARYRTNNRYKEQWDKKVKESQKEDTESEEQKGDINISPPKKG